MIAEFRNVRGVQFEISTVENTFNFSSKEDALEAVCELLEVINGLNEFIKNKP